MHARRRLSAILAALFLLAFHAGQVESQPVRRAISSVDVQRLANAVLGVMTYTVTPDVTTSSLAISNAATGSPGLTISQLGGGFTWSKSVPLYLEGNAAYSRFDPVFAASDGAAQRLVPVKWDSFSATVGVGWDFHLSKEWVFRPIVNAMLGTVTSDLKLAKWWLDNNTNLDLSFLNGGRLDVYGVGGSLMLDYESFAPEHDDDLELRYTDLRLHSYDTPNPALAGHASAQNISVWARRRIPTGAILWQRPVRYVLEGAYTRFLGDQRAIGIDEMASIGFGLEFDSSAKDIWVTRWRALVRYKFGPHFEGWSLGLAVSF